MERPLRGEVGSYNMFGKSGIESTSVWYGDSFWRDADTIRKPEVYSMGIPQTLILLLYMAERPASPMSSKT